jgi:uncharacterized protein (TIGR00255 family)
MLVSMTGFACVDGQESETRWSFEARSVNGRGLDLRFRFPAGWGDLEALAREEAGRRFRRGSIQIGLQLARAMEAPRLRLNQAMLDQVIAAAEALRARLPEARLNLDGLLALPGVIESAAMDETEAERARLRAVLAAGLAEVLDRLALARAAEGARLGPVLSGHLDEIARLGHAADEAAAARGAGLRARLREQIAALIEAAPGLPEDRLAQEAALLFTRIDVREEIDRLNGHVAAARALLESGEAVGRQLDFLTQELNREANTLCAKAADLALTRLGLELKAAIERLREQVQNVE